MAGGAAVKAALAGETGKMSALKRLHNHHAVANLEKKVPLEWITSDGTHVTKDFVHYARPLIQGEMSPMFVNGVPMHMHLR